MTFQNTNLPLESNLSDAELKTRIYFNGYFDEEINIDSSVHDAIYSFFLRELGDGASAESFTHSLITIAYQNKTNPLELLEKISTEDGVSVDAIMAALINRSRRDTSLIGVKQPKPTNPIVARNILS